jgi:threonine dehydrogenase-like Zn-dependent dehydrogenase
VHRALQILNHSEWRDKFARQVTHRFPLQQANEALETVKQHRSGKAVIVP